MGKPVQTTSVLAEIERLHEFFVEWFSGAVPDRDEVFEARFLSRFDRNFRLIPPSGAVLDLPGLAGAIREGYGSNPDFRIAIRNLEVRAAGEPYIFATYEEWQRNALASQPRDNARVASVVLLSGEPLKWLRVHETWLPRAVMEAGPYDF